MGSRGGAALREAGGGERGEEVTSSSPAKWGAGGERGEGGRWGLPF